MDFWLSIIKSCFRCSVWFTNFKKALCLSKTDFTVFWKLTWFNRGIIICWPWQTVFYKKVCCIVEDGRLFFFWKSRGCHLSLLGLDWLGTLMKTFTIHYWTGSHKFYALAFWLASLWTLLAFFWTGIWLIALPLCLRSLVYLIVFIINIFLTLSIIFCQIFQKDLNGSLFIRLNGIFRIMSWENIVFWADCKFIRIILFQLRARWGLYVSLSFLI